jgi:hypothetical protein
MVIFQIPGEFAILKQCHVKEHKILSKMSGRRVFCDFSLRSYERHKKRKIALYSRFSAIF